MQISTRLNVKLIVRDISTDEAFDSENNNISQWNATLESGGSGAGSSRYAVSMANAALQSPDHMHKRRRLSRLLDKLAVQLRNNNNYPPPPWFLYYNQTQETPAEEAPLDLSVKSEQALTTGSKFTCETCGQTFALHDRLAKHIASRHRPRTPEAARAYECDICRRRFARSDMLTRHARLHSGVKPYSCGVCGQVFSRSDHLATHQRTHTGEKPYRCPMCPYAACRRDMITRHLRTHSKHGHTTNDPKPKLLSKVNVT
ncbi:zinc finger protein 135-like [Pectinophora gossypiella]|uniref:zinc finger protein 135-like n=1 Tax=Pectinophora gossypiella TaxID=13191 RepID=UPI00214ED995|nr:zinc finger protein 135-like [Pectinophora gossypiella]